MTISLHEASVGVYVPYLRNLSALLDHARGPRQRAQASILTVLLGMRLAPNMYSLRAAGRGSQPACVVLSCALLAGCVRRTVFRTAEPDIAELKARIAAAIDFAQGLPRPTIERRCRQGGRVHIQERRTSAIHRASR